MVATRAVEHLELDAPKTVFSMVPYRGSENERTYDVTADGRRVLVIRIPAATAPRRIEIVTDWLSELPRLVGGKR